MLICKQFHTGKIVSVASSMYGFDLYFCLTDFMLFLSPYIGYSHDASQKLSKEEYRFGSIIHVWIRHIFSFIDFMIRFADIILFLIPYIGCRTDTLQTLTRVQEGFGSISHECIQSKVLLH